MFKTFKKLIPVYLFVFIISSGLIASTVNQAFAADDIVKETLMQPFSQVVTNLKREIAGHKLVVVKEVPFQQMLGMVGVKAVSILGVEIFHPRYGKVIYEEDREAFIDVPLRILVIESGNSVMLMYRKPSVVFAPYSGLDDLGEELDEIFADIIARVEK